MTGQPDITPLPSSWKLPMSRSNLSVLLRGAAVGAAIATFASAYSPLEALGCNGACSDGCDECQCVLPLNCCHSCPELWVINTRCAPRCRNLDAGFERITYKRWDPSCRRFVRESRETFLANEASMPSLFYIHGNSLEHDTAMKACWWFYQKMRCCEGQKRLVFWSWPSERVIRGLRLRKVILGNLRLKLHYAEHQGYYMAKLVQQMSLSQRVTLTGHSYGGITAAVALHYLGGGEFAGRVIENGYADTHPNLRAAIISGAFDCDNMYPGCRYGQSFVAAEKIYVTRNVRDRTLSGWPNISYRGRKAIGITGLNRDCLGQYGHKLCQMHAPRSIRRQHRFRTYLESDKIVGTICCFAIPGCYGCQSASEGDSAEEVQVQTAADHEQKTEELPPENLPALMPATTSATELTDEPAS